MNKIRERMKNIFKREPRFQPSTTQAPPAYSSNLEDRRSGFPTTITKPPQTSDDDDDGDDDDDIDPGETYNIPQQTQFRNQPRESMQSEPPNKSGNPYSTSSSVLPGILNPGNPALRNNSSGFVFSGPGNNSVNPPSNPTSNAAIPIPPPPSQSGSPFLSQIQNPAARAPLNPVPPSATTNPASSLGGFPPGMNLNQSAPAPASNPSTGLSGFPPGMNLNRTPAPVSSPPTPPANPIPTPPVPAGPNTNSAPALPAPGMNDANNTINRMSSFQSENNTDDNVSRLELDYPIESILVDADIPSAVAIKINDAVERDRLGNAYRVHRYTYEPTTQQISLRNKQQVIRRLKDDPHAVGMRHIREIPNDQQGIRSDDIDRSRRNHRRHRPHRQPSEINLDQYIDELISQPGTVILHADNTNSLQHLIHGNIFNSSFFPQSSPVIQFPPKPTYYPEPVFYYTARALPHDPMRGY